MPECAYVYLARENIAPWIDRMAKAGVRRVLFHSKKVVDPGDVEKGPEGRHGDGRRLPDDAAGEGNPRLHKFFAGV